MRDLNNWQVDQSPPASWPQLAFKNQEKGLTLEIIGKLFIDHQKEINSLNKYRSMAGPEYGILSFEGMAIA
jgi:hypothetical protein